MLTSFEPAVAVEDLTKDQLVRIVRHIQQWLYLDEDDEPFWNPDKLWEFDYLEWLSEDLLEVGLMPIARRIEDV